MKKLRLGIVGPGLIWERVHRPEVERLHDSFEVTAFSARSQATADKVRAAYPQARFHYDYHDLVNDAYVDAVVILTPIPLNAPVASATLEAGKAAFLEKPIGVSVEEARALCEVEDRSEGRIYVLEQAPYGPVWDTMERTLQQGGVGRAVAYETARHARLQAHASGERDFGDTEWRIRPEYPLGVLFDGGVHELATQARLFGAPTHVHAVGRSYREGYGEVDHVSVILEYPDGVFGVFSHSGVLGGKSDYFILRGTDGLIRYTRDEFLLEDATGRHRELPRSDISPHRAMWDHFVECLQEDRTPRYTSRDALREIETLSAIEEAIRTGMRTAVRRAATQSPGERST